MAMTVDDGSSVDGVHGPADEAMSLRRRIAILFLLLGTEFFYGWAWNTVDVLRPYLRSSFGLTLVQAGSMYTAQGSGALIGGIVAGQLADRYGRRLMLALVVAGYGTLLIAGTVVETYFSLLAQRFLMGACMGGYFSVEVGIYVNLFRTSLRGRVAGLLNAFFSLSIVALGVAMGMVVDHGWRALLWIGGIPALVLAALALIVIPAHSPIDRFHARSGALPVLELFHRGVIRQTLMLAAMTGLNFFGYQAFSGWLSTYLIDVRHFDDGTAGRLVAVVYAGNIIGGFAWGWAADRFGRRFNAVGFVVAAAAIAVYLAAPNNLLVLRIAGITYGTALCCSVIWGVWLAELYPPHLRSTAASIFNWGRIISMIAPLATARMAGSVGLTASMASASVAFLLAALIWLFQRETLYRPATVFMAPEHSLINLG